MSYPVKEVRRPAALSGQYNGQLNSSIMTIIDGLENGPDVKLVKVAARAWVAMTQTAHKDGITLKAVGVYDSYRPYEVQKSIFLQRFTTSPVSNTRRYWQGRYWYLRPGMALAAVPGTSNHGWGLAVDTGSERDGDPSAESISTPAINWLKANADSFGFSWEVQSEPWHLRYYAGDNIPQRVLAYEKGTQAEPPTPPARIKHMEPVVSLKVTLPALGPGDQGGLVKTAQKLMVDHFNQKLTYTGVMDEATVKAVNNIKTLMGLNRDGIIGTKVWTFMLDQTFGDKRVVPIN